MKKIIAAAVVASFLLVGCTGSFPLSGKLYKYHRSQEKWVDEGIFLVCAILPVYAVTLTVDYLVLNSIEFWSGKDPLAATGHTESINIATGGDANATLSFDQQSNRMLLSISKDHQPFRDMTIEKTDRGIMAKDPSGQIRFWTMNHEDGSMSLFNGQDQLIQTFDKAQIEGTISKFRG